MAIKDLTQVKRHLFFCNGGSCKNKGAEESTSEIRNIIAEQGLDPIIHTTKTLCNGRCNDGPIVITLPECNYYKGINADRALSFVEIVLKQEAVWHEQLLYEWDAGKMNENE
jgi:(2Fe-2S) ferredoxin